MSNLFPTITNDEVLKLCLASQKSCRCDGGGGECGPCRADTKLKGIGISLDNESIKDVIAKLEKMKNPVKGGAVGFYCCTGIGHAKDCPNVKNGHVSGDTNTFYRPEQATTQAVLNNIEGEPHFNKLTPGQLERLAILQEECGEVVRAVGKILRHGYESYHPNKEGHVGNRGELELEIGDVLGAIALMTEKGDVKADVLLARMPVKRARIMQYAHHQE